MRRAGAPTDGSTGAPVSRSRSIIASASWVWPLPSQKALQELLIHLQSVGLQVVAFHRLPSATDDKPSSE